MNVVTLTDDNFASEVNDSKNPCWSITGLHGVDLVKW